MKICYNKLQKLMIDNQMKRQDLMRAAEITSYAATKINKNEPVSLEVLMRICQVFHCDIGDICEVILDEVEVNDIFRQIAKENGTTEKAVKEEMQFAIREAMKSAEPEAIAFWKAVAPDGKEPPIEKVIAMIALNVNNRMYN